MGHLLTILALGFAVWVLQQILRGVEDRAKDNKGKGNNAAKGPAPRPRRQVNDLDRFLEETRRRKQQEEGRPVAAAEAAPPRSSGRLAAPEREQSQPPAPRPRPSQQPQRPAPRAEPARPRPSQPPPPVPPAPVEVVPLTEFAAAESRRAPVVPSRVQRQASGPLAGELLGLLRGQRGPALAFVLREILDRPVSERPR